MSPRAAAEFSKQWPALQRRLRAFLRNKGVTSSEIDDLTQEVATRLLSFWHKVDRSRPAWPLVATIALNLLRDRGRRPDIEVLGELPDVAGSPDAADAGIARLELAAVLRAMESLTPSQRAALLQVVDPELADGRSTSAEKMLRMRARRRLANVVGRACAGISLRFRRTADTVTAFFTKADGVAQALACATCLFVASAGSTVLLPSFGGSMGDEALAAPATTVVTDSLHKDASVASFVVPSGEELRPARTSTDARRAVSRGSKKAGTHAVAPAAGVTTPAPAAGLPLPGQAPVPGTPPSLPPAGPPPAPDTPTEPPPITLDGEVPEAPADLPVDAPSVPGVGEVTGSVKTTGR